MKRLIFAVLTAVAFAAVVLATGGGVTTTRADPHPGQSVNVAIIGSPTVINGGSLATPGPVGELGDFTFTNLAPASVNAANLAAFDTAVLNVASPEMWCSTGTLSASAKADLVAFVAGGGKLIIYDSECPPADYSWLPYPFSTSNPGAMGAQGTLTIVEENVLSTSNPLDPHFIDAPALGTNTDAVGDMNVMTTLDPNWCLDMQGTNVLSVTGPVHTYAQYGAGFMIYNGLDVDYMGFEPAPPAPNGLHKIWVQELQAPFNPIPPGTGLGCIPVVGIDLDPATATNEFGTSHTVTATVLDTSVAPPEPIAGVAVSFEVTSGPNAGQVSDAGECSANADCTTDASGQVSWTYTDAAGVAACDTIVATATISAGEVVSQEVTKCWEAPPNTPPEASCTESVNPSGKQVPPAGRTTLPGSWGGQNEDGFYRLDSRDAEDGTTALYVTNASGSAIFGPFASGSVVKITEAPGATPSSKPMGGPNSAVAAHITLDSDALVFAVDSSGVVSTPVSCLVPPPPK
ncbi:MAG: hypothetical protein EPO22_08780 [Dehalococcoidia bacterium]|nr:MAG: hypothetical protein EPO22_08780 [Dehalococcoidia bacterium]